MSKINLTNWEIVDEMQNGEVVIRSKVTGKELRLHQSGELMTENIDNDGIIETQDLVVNGTATGPFNSVMLEPGDSITVATIDRSDVDQGFETLYNGTAKDVLGGVVTGFSATDFLYEFSDNTTLRKNGTGTSFTVDNESLNEDEAGDRSETDFLPPAKDVIRIDVGCNNASSTSMGAEVILKD
jgi:hypothetical protein